MEWDDRMSDKNSDEFAKASDKIENAVRKINTVQFLSRLKIKVWKRYVDDSFSVTKSSAVNKFHQTLNYIDPSVSFTIKHENDKFAFLYTTVFRKNNTLATGVYRKPTHTDRYLDYHSHHFRKHNLSTAITLLHRISILPSSEEEKTSELAYITNALVAKRSPNEVHFRNMKKPKENIPTPKE